jgi:hypothetical protein
MPVVLRKARASAATWNAWPGTHLVDSSRPRAVGVEPQLDRESVSERLWFVLELQHVYRPQRDKVVEVRAVRHTNPPGIASTSMENAASRRTSSGILSGTTGRSFSTVSPLAFWIRLARTTTPAASSARSGVSKKYTCRTCASSGPASARPCLLSARTPGS